MISVSPYIEQIRLYNNQSPYTTALLVPSKEAVAVLGDAFTEQNHMLNSTMKMVRGKIVDFDRIRLDDLYTAEGRSILNVRNRAIVARLD